MLQHEYKNKQKSNINGFQHNRNWSSLNSKYVPKLFLVWRENDYRPPPPPTIETQCRRYLSCYWLYFDETQTDSKRHYGICPGNICPGNICPYREYLCSNWTPFDQTLKVGSWDHLNGFLLLQWHWSRHHMSWQHLSISGISHLLLTQFWPNFLDTIFCRFYLFFINIFLR